MPQLNAPFNCAIELKFVELFGNVEFKVRLCNHENDFDQIHTLGIADDIFIISDNDFPFELQSPSNIEKIKTSEINEIKYLLSLTTSL